MEKPVEYIVRNSKKGDEMHLAKLFSECFEPTTPSWVRLWMKRSGRKPKEIFVGVVGGKPVSHVNVGIKQLHHGEGFFLKTAGIGGVCTDSDYRKKGLVTNLLKISLNNAQQNGVSNAALYTGLDMPAHRIYQRLGFVDITTERTYIKFLDFPFIFVRLIRVLNRRLKDSKIAKRELQSWERSVIIELKDLGPLAFRVRRGRFERLKKPPKKPDIVLSTDILTFAQIIREGVIEWDKAAKTKKLTWKRGEPTDVEMLKRILRWMWGD